METRLWLGVLPAKFLFALLVRECGPREATGDHQRPTTIVVPR